MVKNVIDLNFIFVSKYENQPFCMHTTEFQYRLFCHYIIDVTHCVHDNEYDEIFQLAI